MADEKVQLIDDEEIITLFDEDDNPMDFYEVAVVEYEGELYALLQPAEEIEGIAEDEAVQEAVFEEYLRATADGCDGDCSGCDAPCEDKEGN